MNRRLWIVLQEDDKFQLKVFIDSDWSDNVDDKKSTSGGAFFLGKRLISWTSKK